MSTIKSSDEHLTLNADGSSKDIKFQANGVEKASISSAGAFTSTTIDATKLTGNLPAISGASLTGLPADATKAPLANPTFTGTVSKSGSSSGTAKIFTTASDASEIYLYMGTGATKFRKQDDSANTLQILPNGRVISQSNIGFWVNFNGTGTVAIRDSYNVTSIGDWGTGDYGIYITSGFSNTNYAYASMCQDDRIATLNRDNTNPQGGRLDVSVARSWDAALTDNETISVLAIGDM